MGTLIGATGLLWRHATASSSTSDVEREGTRWESGTVPQRYAGTTAVIGTGAWHREATAFRCIDVMRACESEDLPVVPGAPRPAAHRLVEKADVR